MAPDSDDIEIKSGTEARSFWLSGEGNVEESWWDRFAWSSVGAPRKTVRSQPGKPKSKIPKKDKKTPEVEKHGAGEESDNSIDWGDVSIDEEILGDLLDCVKEAYDEVRSEYDRVVETDGLVSFSLPVYLSVTYCSRSLNSKL
uniref:Uncharacterized protein n=1 Tax=Ascaris lumbricoides TaxID=6252 RepID=A0A0M3IH27_ASCLU